MNRRSLIVRFGLAALGIAGFSFTHSAEAKSKTASPQSDAVALVIEKRQKEIERAEREYFKANGMDWWNGDINSYKWHDTITRSWSAFRPIAPGIVDSTHSFVVKYSINNKVVAAWSVDTDKETVRPGEF